VVEGKTLGLIHEVLLDQQRDVVIVFWARCNCQFKDRVVPESDAVYTSPAVRVRGWVSTSGTLASNR
jgi:hypothetical protein